MERLSVSLQPESFAIDRPLIGGDGVVTLQIDGHQAPYQTCSAIPGTGFLQRLLRLSVAGSTGGRNGTASDASHEGNAVKYVLS